MKRNSNVGLRFGRLIVLKCVGKDKWNNALWECRCDCGNITVTSSLCLTRKHTKSCGCLANEGYAGVHNMSKTPEFNTWMHMIIRCSNPLDAAWKNYGGRGITVCDAWKSDFTAFYNYVGPRPTPKHTIERINNNGNYEPGNVKWATRLEQNSNTRRVRLLTANGETMTLSAWARELQICVDTLRGRLERWPTEKALTTPKLHCRLH